MDFRKRRRITDPNPEPNPRHATSDADDRETNTWEANQNADPHPEISLPPDLVSDVLSRLPVKTLARLRCVCKQWYSLTYDSYFIRTQHERARSRPVFINTFLSDKTITHYEFGGDGKLERNSFTVESGFNEESAFYSLWNSVNGLNCASGGRRDARSIWLLNPTTREFLQLPSPCDRDDLGLEYFGLGLDDSIGEYKVVRIVSGYRPNSFHCEILTVGTQKWRYVGLFPLWITDLVPVFLHGALHWGAKHKGTGYGGAGRAANRMNIILPFDIKNETFGSVIPVPSDLPLVKLGELGGRLCTIMQHPLQHSLEIWTLKDNGSCQWTKEFSVTLNFFVCSCMLPFVVDTTDQKILFQTCSNIYSYDIQTKTSSKVYHEIEGPFLPAAHIEGLVSPRKIVENLQIA